MMMMIMTMITMMMMAMIMTMITMMMMMMWSPDVLHSQPIGSEF